MGFFTKKMNGDRKILQSEIKKKKKEGKNTNETQMVKVADTPFKSLEAPERTKTGSVTRNEAAKWGERERKKKKHC